MHGQREGRRCPVDATRGPCPASPGISVSMSRLSVQRGRQRGYRGENCEFQIAASILTLIVTLAIPALASGNASAAGVKVGTLSCNLAPTVGFIVGSRQRLTCRYTPDGPWPPEIYFGHSARLPASTSASKAARAWCGRSSPRPTGITAVRLPAPYIGASADVAVGVGLGANALVGGSRRSIALQPLSVEANTGVNLAAGVSRLRLDWAR